MQKKSAKKSQPKSRKPEFTMLVNIHATLNRMEQILDRIAEMMAEKNEAEDSPDTPDEAA